MSKRAKITYGIFAAFVFALFTYLFSISLPGGEHPVITGQPVIAMPISYPWEPMNAVPIETRVDNGRISFPLSVLLEKRMVEFEYKTEHSTIPLLAYISAEGKLVTAVRMCEPCNSKTFRIEGNELTCGNCETRWKLNNLEGLQGSCQKYPPDPIPSVVIGNQVQINENSLKTWKMRI